MIELLQISCLISHIWPKLEAHLGQGKALDDLAKMWEMGSLGCQGLRFGQKTVYPGKPPKKHQTCSGIYFSMHNLKDLGVSQHF